MVFSCTHNTKGRVDRLDPPLQCAHNPHCFVYLRRSILTLTNAIRISRYRGIDMVVKSPGWIISTVCPFWIRSGLRFSYTLTTPFVWGCHTSVIIRIFMHHSITQRLVGFCYVISPHVFFWGSCSNYGIRNKDLLRKGSAWSQVTKHIFRPTGSNLLSARDLGSPIFLSYGSRKIWLCLHKAPRATQVAL